MGLRGDGTPFPLELRRADFELAGKPATLLVVRDLEERRRLESALARTEANYRQLTENSPDLILRVSAEGRCSWASPSCLRLLGYRPEELVGRRVLELVHRMDRRAILANLTPENLFLSSLDLSCRLRRSDGSYRWFEVESRTFAEPGTGTIQSLALARDIGERVKAEQYRIVRHEVTAIQAAAAEPAASDPRFLEVVGRNLGWDVGELWLVDGENLILRRDSSWCAPSASLRAFTDGSARVAFSPGLGLPGLAWSRADLVWMEDVSRTPDIVRNALVSQARLRGALAFPVVDGTRILGVMSFLRRASLAPDRDLFDLLIAVGRQVGEYLSRARAEASLRADTERLGELVEERSRRLRVLQDEVARQQRLEREVLLAAEVQRSLLPATLPSIDGFELGAVALPARYVSGDFYDFSFPDPQTCDILLADISGKGVPAAMMNSAARALLRRESMRRKPPGPTLASLNEALFGDLDRAEMFLTALMARLDRGRNRVTYASAGHTETLRFVAATGRCERLPATSAPVGVGRILEVAERSVGLRPGDFLLFYSDGVTEAASPEGELFGMERFEALAERLRDKSAEGIAAAISVAVREFSGDTPLADDLTVVVLKSLPRILRWRLRAELPALDPLLTEIRGLLEAWGGETAYRAELAIAELATNVIRHACSAPAPGEAAETFDLVLRLEADRVVVDVLDRGEPFDPAALPPPSGDPLAEGGRGLGIIEALVEEFSYVPRRSAAACGTSGEGAPAEGLDPDSNHWRLVLRAKGGGT